jgi:hypothetical protein
MNADLRLHPTGMKDHQRTINLDGSFNMLGMGDSGWVFLNDYFRIISSGMKNYLLSVIPSCISVNIFFACNDYSVVIDQLIGISKSAGFEISEP